MPRTIWPLMWFPCTLIIMKIYFAASIRGGRADVENYAEIIAMLSKYGQVLTEHVGDHNITALGETSVPDENIRERDLHWLAESEVMVAEVTTPSLGVGYELAFAEQHGKRVLCLFRKQKDQRLSAIIAGNPLFTVRTYRKLQDLVKVFSDFFRKQ